MRLLKLAALAFCPLVWTLSNAGSILIGVEYMQALNPPFNQPQSLYRIDPATGEATPNGTTAYPFELTRGPEAGQAIMMSPINPYIVNVFTGQIFYPGSYKDPVGFPAYDNDRQTMWGVAGHADNTLWSFAKPQPCTPPCFRVGMQVGTLGISDSLVIDYDPGVGLFGIDSLSPTVLYSINKDTGLATPFLPLLGATLVSKFERSGLRL